MHPTQHEHPRYRTPEELRRRRHVPQSLPEGSGKQGINLQEILLQAAARGLTRFFADNLFPSHRHWPPARSVSRQRRRAVGAGLATGPTRQKPLSAAEPGWAKQAAPCQSPVAAESLPALANPRASQACRAAAGTGEQPLVLLGFSSRSGG